MHAVLTHEWLFGAYLLFMTVGLLSTSTHRGGQGQALGLLGHDVHEHRAGAHVHLERRGRRGQQREDGGEDQFPKVGERVHACTVRALVAGARR